jgi:hypothetical protein
MLGHLSEHRNTEDLAARTVLDHFKAEDVDVVFDLRLAPRLSASEVVRIA